MKKSIDIISSPCLIILSLLVFMGCEDKVIERTHKNKVIDEYVKIFSKPKQMAVADFPEYTESPESGLTIKIIDNGRSITGRIITKEEIILRELSQGSSSMFTKKRFKEKLKESDDDFQIKLTFNNYSYRGIEPNNSNKNPGNIGLTDNISGYLNYNAQNDIKLVTENDTLNCILYFYENSALGSDSYIITTQFEEFVPTEPFELVWLNFPMNKMKILKLAFPNHSLKIPELIF